MFYQRKRKNSNDDNNDIDSENIVVKYCYSRATAEEEDISNDEHQYHGGRYRYGGEKGDEAGDGGERTNSNPSNSALECNRRSEEADTIYNNESTPPRKLCWNIYKLTGMWFGGK